MLGTLNLEAVPPVQEKKTESGAKPQRQGSCVKLLLFPEFGDQRKSVAFMTRIYMLDLQ